MTAAEKERDILAHTLWGEARGDGADGQVAVAWTTRNRLNDGKTNSCWGEGYEGGGETLAVQLLEQERSEFPIPQWC